VSEEMLKTDADKLATRNPVPAPKREIQNLEVGEGAPPAPEIANPDVAELTKKLRAYETQNAEYKDALQKKDVALADSKAAKVALETQAKGKEEKPITDGPDMSALISETVATKVAEALAAESRRNEPAARAVREFGEKQEKAEAVDAYGAEAVDKYQDAAIEQQKEFPGMTLVKAYKLVVPGGVKTAPATPVESSRTPPPDAKPDQKDIASGLLAEARGLNSRGDRLMRTGKLEEYVKQQASSLFPHGG